MADQEHKDRPMQLLSDKTSLQYSGFVNLAKGSYQVKQYALHNSHKEIGGIRHPQENTALKKSTKLQQNSKEQWNKALANVRLRIDMPGRVSLEPTSGMTTVDRLPSPIIGKMPSSFGSISNPSKIILKNPITSPIYPSMNPPGQTSRQARKWEFDEYQQGRDQQLQAKDNDGPGRDGRMPKRISLHPGSMQSHPITLSARSGSAVEDVDGLFGTSGLSDEPDLASDRKTSEWKLRSGRPPPDDGAINPGSNLLVTGIHPRLSEQEVTRLFEKYGDVEKCRIVLDRDTKESRGFGFVRMVTAEQTDAAKEGLEGEVIEGRTLSIEKARHARPPIRISGKYFGRSRKRDDPREPHGSGRPPGVPPVPHSEAPPPLPGQLRGIPPQGSGLGPEPWPLSTFEHKRDHSTMEQILEALPPRNVSAGSSSSGWNRDADKLLIVTRARKKICISSYTISEDLSGDRGDLILSRISEKKRDGNFRFRKERFYIGHQSLRHRGET